MVSPAALTVRHYGGDARSALQLLSLSLSLLREEEVLTPAHVDKAHSLLSERLAYEPLYRLSAVQAAAQSGVRGHVHRRLSP